MSEGEKTTRREFIYLIVWGIIFFIIGCIVGVLGWSITGLWGSIIDFIALILAGSGLIVIIFSPIIFWLHLRKEKARQKKQ